MTSITEEEIHLFKELAKMEGKWINSIFKKYGEDGGLAAYRMVTDSFIDFLEKQIGKKFIPAMNMSYRFYTLELLSNIEEEYLPEVFSTLFSK